MDWNHNRITLFLKKLTENELRHFFRLCIPQIVYDEAMNKRKILTLMRTSGEVYSLSSSSGLLLLYTPRCFNRDRKFALFSCRVSISRRCASRISSTETCVSFELSCSSFSRSWNWEKGGLVSGWRWIRGGFAQLVGSGTFLVELKLVVAYFEAFDQI